MARAFPSANKTKRRKRTSRRGQCIARARTSAPDPSALRAHFAAEKRARTACHFHRCEAAFQGRDQACGRAATHVPRPRSARTTFLALFAVGNGRALRVGGSLQAPRSLGSSHGKLPGVNAAGPRKHLPHALPPQFSQRSMLAENFLKKTSERARGRTQSLSSLYGEHSPEPSSVNAVESSPLLGNNGKTRVPTRRVASAFADPAAAPGDARPLTFSQQFGVRKRRLLQSRRRDEGQHTLCPCPRCSRRRAA